MATGTRWIYRTRAEDADLASPIDRTTVCEVLETVERKGARAALVRGFPLGMDLSSDSALDAATTLLTCVAASQYHAQNEHSLGRLKDPGDLLLGLVDENTLFLECPLVEGKRFGDFEQVAREDFRYCWLVESEREMRLRGIRGVSPWRSRRVYRLVYFTNPDEQHILFAPGIGIIEYTYHHHGTVSDLNMRLADFQSAEGHKKKEGP
jgi:hypothetical protein